jgi:mannose-1-phosphate guanylyltransferase/mannose-6-phosphate isomerase
MDKIIPVILAGGIGSRLWPLSRSSCPKQFMNILGEHTLLQETLLRSLKISDSYPILVYNKEYHLQVKEQARSIGIQSLKLLIEPASRNTCPAITLAAFEAQNHDEDAFLFVMPADHFLHYENEDDFIQQIHAAKSLADKGWLVTFGVIPHLAEAGYGYIKVGQMLDLGFSVEKFIEKPAQEIAAHLITDKNYLWNSGIFFFRVSTYLTELRLYASEVYRVCLESYRLRKIVSGNTHVHPNFLTCPSISVDYALMEHTKMAAVIPMNAKWSDVGSWSSLFDLKTKDSDGNIIQGDALIEKSKNCYVHSSNRLVAAVGLEDQIIIETRDAVLVLHRSKTQEIKGIVERLNLENRAEASSHYHVYRPWGAYELLIDLPGYKVKKLTVKIGNSLSLQRHHHRSEHWVVVSGVATVINGDEHLVLYPSQATHIPLGVRHRLSNFSDQLLEIIEIQVGDYLGEDDIERFDDLYGRSEPLIEHFFAPCEQDKEAAS